MEMVATLPNGNAGNTGTQKHVQEWSRIDHLTGMLEHARVEADHWANNTTNSRHHFGKVVDSRARNLADGSVQQKQQMKQLEVFQAHTAGGSVQVIRSHTSTTSSWHNSKVLRSDSSQRQLNVENKLISRINELESRFDDLKLAHHSVNLETEKTKALVARSLGSRRPPTRNKMLKIFDNENEQMAKVCGTTTDKLNVADYGMNGFSPKNELNHEMTVEEIRPHHVQSIKSRMFDSNVNGYSHSPSLLHKKLESKKSTSNENLAEDSVDPWIRCKNRLSLPLKPKFKDKLDIPQKSELENILEKVLRKKESVADDGELSIKPTPLWKRKSWLTDDALKETKEKLRPLHNDEADDGICTSSPEPRANGSDSPGSQKVAVKSDEWFSRRKSYGFEAVFEHDRTQCTTMDSSTDSGICQSTDLVSTPIVRRLLHNAPDNLSMQSQNSNQYCESYTSTTAALETKEEADVEDREIVKKGKIEEAIRSLRDSSSMFNASLVMNQRGRASDCSDELSKRHSIACDSAALEAESSPATRTVLSVSRPLHVGAPSFDAEKKPKKVEFSKTEVHFAAEPGKINIVETDEKPPPTSVYRRRRRSASDSPHRSFLPQIKFGDSEKMLLLQNSTHDSPEKLLDGEFEPSSSTCDNGLAVRISSTKPLDYRRASWSANDPNGKGYSTKINFGNEGGTTVVKKLDSCEPGFRKPNTSVTNVNENRSEKCREKLIVRIGSSGTHTEHAAQMPSFTNSFRSSIPNYVNRHHCDNLKSTTLIIDSMKCSTQRVISNSVGNDASDRVEMIEQPSTYIMEMNRLQRRHVESVEDVRWKDRTKYNTIPMSKCNVKLSNDADLPSVLSAFDTLCKTYDRAMEDKQSKKTSGHHHDGLTLETTKVQTVRRQPIRLIFDSQLKPDKSFYYNSSHVLGGGDEGEISDDSLQADQEVRSYMSTAILEQYERELRGSWSRKRYFRHIKPVKVTNKAEIPVQSYFKPLRLEEEKLKNSIKAFDVKQPKITSFSVKIDKEPWKGEQPKKSTTVLLNKNHEYETTEIVETNEESKHGRIDGKFTNSCLKTNEIAQTNSVERNDSKGSSRCDAPVKMIHHSVKAAPVKIDSSSKSWKCSKDSNYKVGQYDSVRSNNSVRKRTNVTTDKDRLFDSGRDSWMNLPKDRSQLVRKKLEPLKKPSTGSSNGCSWKGDDMMKKLTDAADEILQAVNGYTSTDDEHQQPAKTRTTAQTTLFPKSNAPPPKPALDKSKLANPKINNQQQTLKTEERSRRRQARLRANSRELLTTCEQHASSSDETSTAISPIAAKHQRPRPGSHSAANHVRNRNCKIIQNKAEMKINIFDIKKNPNISRPAKSRPSRVKKESEKMSLNRLYGERRECVSTEKRNHLKSENFSAAKKLNFTKK